MCVPHHISQAMWSRSQIFRAFNIDYVKDICYPQSLRAYKKSLVSQGLLIKAARLQRKEDAALFKDLRHRITLLASPLINWLYSD
jgi:hypothetical protein